MSLIDHGWTEVFIRETEKWIHIDTAEALFDKPKQYEKVQGKKLTYVIAFSENEVVDVTYRYILDLKITQSRRDQIE